MGVCFCQWIYWECCNLLMSSGRLFWSGRETGNTGVALTEMAPPGPWEEGHNPEPFFHKTTWRQVSREWQRVQVMPLTHSVASGCICVMWFSAENRKSGTQWTQFLTLSRKMETYPCFCAQSSADSSLHILCVPGPGHCSSWGHLISCIFCGSGERDLGPSLRKQRNCSTKPIEMGLKEMKTGLGLTFWSQGRGKAWSVTSWKGLHLQGLEWGVPF